MIVDELRAISPEFRELTMGFQVIKVPFSVCPFTLEPDGIPGLLWNNYDDVEHLIPRCPDVKDSIDCSWWRPPFRDMIIVSEKAERGCMVVFGTLKRSTVKFSETLVPMKSDWECVISLIAIEPHVQKLICLTAFHMLGVNGKITGQQDEDPDATAWLWSFLRVTTESEEDERRERDRVFDTLQEIWKQKPEEHKMDVINMAAIFCVTCALMSCKNIVTEEIHHPVKLQKARQRRGNLPLVSFHTLKLKLPSRKRIGTAGSGNGESLALHWVRGHFKHFTADKPLLGRAIGTFWWSPHLAGQADRVLLKDYEIE